MFGFLYSCLSVGVPYREGMTQEELQEETVKQYNKALKEREEKNKELYKEIKGLLVEEKKKTKRKKVKIKLNLDGNFVEDYLDAIEKTKVIKSERLDRVEPEDNNGIGVSTVWTSDEGYETAILDDNGVHPVERYKSEKLALEGHKKWIEKSKTLTKVTKLGLSYAGIEDEEIVIKRVESEK